MDNSFLHPNVYYYNEKGEMIKLILNYNINIDDNIDTIKKKIVDSIDINNITTEEIYMFVNSFKIYDIKTIYNEITQNSTIELNDMMIKQLMINFNYDDKYINAVPSNKIFTLEELSEILDFNNNQQLLTAIPLGKNKRSYNTTIDVPLLFSVNPYLNIDYLIEPLELYENYIFMNYKFVYKNDIYVCIPEYIIKYYDKKIPKMSVKFFQYYFPELFKKNITNINDYNNYKLKINKVSIDENTMTNWKIIDIFYKHYKTINSLDNYPSCKMNTVKNDCFSSDNYETNIIKFSILFKSVYNIKIPLDIIFKKINSCKEIPLIRLNPGMKQKNIIRFYYEQINENGIKKPYIIKANINRIILEMVNNDKNKNISLYIVLENDIELCMVIKNNGDIKLYSLSIKNPITIDKLKNILLEKINPIIVNINENIKMNGFVFSIFYNFKNDPNFKINYINYFIKYNIPLKNDFIFKNYENLFTSIFYIENIKNQSIYNKNGGAKMYYKRISNYKGKDNKSIFIEKLINNKNISDKKVIDDIITAVIKEFNYNNDERDRNIIRNLIQNVLNDVDINNNGFLTSFTANEKKILSINIDDVNDMDYIICIDIYLKCIIDIIENKRKIIKDEQILKKDEDIKDIPLLYPSDISKPLKKDIKNIDDYIIENIDKSNKKKYKENNIDKSLELLNIDNEELTGNEDIFDIEDFNLYGGGKNNNDEINGGGRKKKIVTSNEEENTISYDLPENEKRIIGTTLKNTNYFQDKLEKSDPTLFIKNVGNNYNSYSKCCSFSSHKQPIILTKEEKNRLEKEYPEFVKEGHIISYNSTIDLHAQNPKIPIDPDKEFWYICPRYWCILHNRPMTEKEVKEGKGDCGGIIDIDDTKIKPGKYIYEFSKRIKNGKYREHYPYLKKPSEHPYKLTMPCCRLTMTKPKITKKNTIDDNIPPPPIKKSNKIINIYKVDTQLNKETYGVLPPILEKLFNENYKNKLVVKQHMRIKPINNVFLRYGVEKTNKQQFLSIFAEIYFSVHNLKKEETKTLVQLKQILKKKLTIDIFITLFNGSLIKLFYNKNKKINIHDYNYRSSNIYKKIDFKNIKQKKLLIKIIRSYENYMDYLMDDTIDIDHTFLWDLFTIKSELLNNMQFNLVIIDITNRDITQDVDFLCPKNSSNPYYNDSLPTIFVIKKDSVYELIYNVTQESNSFKIKKWFYIDDIVSINPLLKLISKNNKCNTVYPKTYKFINPPTLNSLIDIFNENKYYNILHYVLQYNGKIIAIIVQRSSSQSSPLYVPCYPSAINQEKEDVSILFIDEVKWISFKNLINEYEILNKLLPKISIQLKFRIVEDGLVVGLLTNTDQFIQLNKPIQIEDSNTITSLPILNSNNYNNVDDELINKNINEYTEREKVVRFVYLETKFYTIFRNIVKIILTNYSNRKIILKINKIITSDTLNYIDKFNQINTILLNLKLNIKFANIDEEILLDIDMNESVNNLLNILNDNIENYDKKITFLPKNNLVTKLNNKELYYKRITDEIIRFPQIRKFILNEDTILFDTIDDEFNIDKNEFIILENDLNKYFNKLSDNIFGNKYTEYKTTSDYVMINDKKSFKGGNNNNIINMDDISILKFLFQDIQFDILKKKLLKKYKELLNLNLNIKKFLNYNDNIDIDTFINNINYKFSLFDIMTLVSIYKKPKNLIFFYKKKYICFVYDNNLPFYGLLTYNNHLFNFYKTDIINNKNIFYYNNIDDFITILSII